jgi:hypothetical protein
MKYWQRWCTRSIALLFSTDEFEDFKVEIEPAEYDRTSNPRNAVEIRINRFDTINTHSNFYRIDMDVNILVQTIRTKNYYDHPDAVGLALEALAKSISVYKTQSGDGSLLGCLLRDDEIITIPYSPPSSTSVLCWTTLETTYHMDLEAP